ncbi:hypothetical protein Agabi119p4_7942 [Agaricus bisporus var. burnettii]|uniref:Uncharacterized protein n=1 Tax=Agaricus bisporus var. burnettii TaxID=192524 RepID=A0A8H7C7W9_AGABI|nr:hypothetical protein Agabi119p4_7942 [Agaricus bisporus var. burnettii]
MSLCGALNNVEAVLSTIDGSGLPLTVPEEPTRSSMSDSLRWSGWLVCGMSRFEEDCRRFRFKSSSAAVTLSVRGTQSTRGVNRISRHRYIVRLAQTESLSYVTPRAPRLSNVDEISEGPRPEELTRITTFHALTARLFGIEARDDDGEYILENAQEAHARLVDYLKRF